MRSSNIAVLTFLVPLLCVFGVSLSEDGVDFMEQGIDDNDFQNKHTSAETTEIPRKEELEDQQNQVKDSDTPDGSVEEPIHQHAEGKEREEGNKEGMKVTESDEHGEDVDGQVKGKKEGKKAPESDENDEDVDKLEKGEKEEKKKMKESGGDDEKEEEISHEDKHIEINVDESTGNGTNCGPKESNLQFHWTPEVIDPQGTVKVKVKMTAPVSFGHGTVTIDVAVRGQSHPIFTIAMDVDCEEDIAKNIPPPFTLKCPIQKHMPFPWIPYEETNLTRLPTGAFDVRIRVKNEHEEVFLCLQFSVELKPED